MSLIESVGNTWSSCWTVPEIEEEGWKPLDAAMLRSQY